MADSFPTYVGVARWITGELEVNDIVFPTYVGVARLTAKTQEIDVKVIPTHSGGEPENGGNYCPHSLYCRLFALEALSGWGQYPHTPIPVQGPSRAK